MLSMENLIKQKMPRVKVEAFFVYLIFYFKLVI